MALEIKMALRIFSKKYILSDLNYYLGNPSRGFSIGDKFSKGKKIRGQSFWSFDSSDIDPKSSLDEHLMHIINFIESKEDTLKKLKLDDCNIDITCMLDSNNGQGGAILSALSIKRLSKFGLNLTFDIYADCE